MEAHQIMSSQEPRERGTIEHKLEATGKLTVLEARSMTIESHEDYEKAAQFLVEIKGRTKQIQDYWKGPKDAAYSAHKAVVQKEKDMLTPLAEAENIIKTSMAKYQAAVELARRQAEEEARRLQREEAERLMAQAVKAEESGDDQAATISMAMAEMVEDMKPAPAITDPPKAAGISSSKVWKARIVDEKLVPAYVNGMEVRTINQAALNSIAKMSKGTATVPGIEFYEDTVISARG